MTHQIIIIVLLICCIHSTSSKKINTDSDTSSTTTMIPDTTDESSTKPSISPTTTKSTPKTHAVTQAADAQSPYNNIKFGTPEIVVVHPVAGRIVTLEAFRVAKRENPFWVSFGYPILLKYENGNVFHNSQNDFSIRVEILNELQKTSLVRGANQQYPDLNWKVNASDFVPLMSIKFACEISIRVNKLKYILHGGVRDPNIIPFTIRFPKKTKEGVDIGTHFETRLANENDPLYIHCTMSAAGKEEKSNKLKITSKLMEEHKIADKLLGPANAKSVSRKQAQKFSQDVMEQLDIDEQYELEGESFSFSDEFINKILDGDHFKPVDFETAMQDLSQYTLQMDEKDMTPSQIKKELSKVFNISKTGDKEHLILALEKSERGKENNKEENYAKLGVNVPGIVKVEAEVGVATEKEKEWATGSKSLDDQLREMERESNSDIMFERSGNQIIPKSLNVAKVSRMSINKEMAFTHVKKRLSDAVYKKQYELSTEEYEKTKCKKPPTRPVMKQFKISKN